MKSPKIRRNWGVISPVTKVVPSKKIYDRNKQDVELPCGGFTNGDADPCKGCERNFECS